MTVSEDIRRTLEVATVYARCADGGVADRRNDPRSLCLWNICNRLKLAEETMVFYERAWGGSGLPEVDGELEGELVERAVTVTKDMFVDVVSAIEKAVKDCMGIYRGSGIKEKSLERSSHLYLRNIVEASRDLGYITDSAFSEWDDILVMRNLAVHNNSVSDRSRRFEICGAVISMRPNRMMKGPLNTFVLLTERAVALFNGWLTAVDPRLGVGPS